MDPKTEIRDAEAHSCITFYLPLIEIDWDQEKF